MATSGRQWFAAGFAVVLLAFAGYASRAATASPGDGSALPRSLTTAPAWTAELDDAPIGRALAAFSRMDQARVTLIGPNDAIRVYDRPEWSLTSDDAVTMRVSPDGRLLAMPHWPSGVEQMTRIVDLASGSVRVVEAGAPLAWSADSRQLLVVRFDGDPTERQPHGGELRIVDVATGAISWSVPLEPRADAVGMLTGAFAPNGSAIAVQHGDDLIVHRHDGTGWQVTLDSRRLAGTSAWTPDLRTVLVMDRVGSLHGLDAATGQPTAAPPIDGWPGARLVGWRDGAPVVVDGRSIRLLGPHPAVLATAPADTLELEVAADAVALPLRDPGDPQAGPFAARYRMLLILGAVGLVALACALAVWAWRRRPSDPLAEYQTLGSPGGHCVGQRVARSGEDDAGAGFGG